MAAATKSSLACVSALLAISSVAAQDPAEGWMAYAVGKVPAGTERITRMEMYWTNSKDPLTSSQAFYSPWFGMDPLDNLNLIQPVNPWGGRVWSAYTEYFQWSPVDNSNSDAIRVSAGEQLHGSLIYNSATDSYTLVQTNVASGESSTQIVRCQAGKKYALPYVVYEKVWPCRDYPPDGQVVFSNISVECDGTDCTKDVEWSAEVKDANCDFKANIVSPTEITLTWDTSLASAYDNMTRSELIAKNFHGWATKVPSIVAMAAQAGEQ